MARLQAVVFVTFSVLFPAVWGFAVHADSKGPSRIWGGHEITNKDAPWMAALWIPKNDGNTSFCGGSIVHERFILTAAHCFINIEEPFAPWGYIGMHDIMDPDAVFIQPIEKLCHDRFNAGARYQNDICLLKLKDPIVFGEKVVQITLADAGLALDAGTQLNVSGWGRTEFSNTAVQLLRQVTVPLMSSETCTEHYPSVNNDLQYCAGALGLDSCVGDSGGPLTLGNVQVGVVSYGRQCGTARGGVYVKVTSYLDWISNTINANL
ncbi:trypsin-like [Leguminivora glycinivorella]|uniref:trypsin-like n=1 Tax=Leguminivora glycinivorella TaxID=1035111 RepID=UPI00200C3077|nr:trypsin-like [Leguminivora glycinivorella]